MTLIRQGLVIAAVVLLGSAAAADVPRRGPVDLNEPGALEAVQQTNPAHYETIVKIMEGILKRPERTVPHWIQAAFHARDVDYAPIVLTSHPPKRRLSFTLDATRYDAVVVLTNVTGAVIPAK